MDFIADQTAALRAALQAGDSGRAAQILTRTLLESGRSFEATVREMTEAARRQQHGDH
ncbi:hypothetical protein F0L17_26645 [Streptomyces sp. TRM43335]|uniref:Uncharacterized protein n=1 Tax=Streptomyces taklimakanensis TaxID=2569853 RepID=A0A6G2BK35_9ACTN|nr:hypothetical protein [Streptomyces taklimakanensis]MTE22610.1 hypothetical protein [Streptomyces taklimakanensis]